MGALNSIAWISRTIHGSKKRKKQRKGGKEIEGLASQAVASSTLPNPTPIQKKLRAKEGKGTKKGKEEIKERGKEEKKRSQQVVDRGRQNSNVVYF